MIFISSQFSFPVLLKIHACSVRRPLGAPAGARALLLVRRDDDEAAGGGGGGGAAIAYHAAVVYVPPPHSQPVG